MTEPKVYGQISLDVPVKLLATLNEHVRRRHRSRRSYILQAIEEAIKRDLAEPTVRESYNAAPEQT